ncbi:MAG: outer membrane protein assembly factor BamB family protein [Thermoguttaceae bacterium]
MNASVSEPDDAQGRRQSWARVAVWTAVVSGLFVLMTLALMAWDYSQRLAKDPLDSEEFRALRAQLTDQSASEELKTQIRQMDRALRQAYFRQRRFAAVGAWLLLAGIVVFLAAVRTASTLRRKLPMPEKQPLVEDAETPTTRNARWGVAVLAVLLLGAAAVLSARVRSVLQQAEPEAVWPSNEELAHNWPRFRGPGGLGIFPYDNVPTSWDLASGAGILWKTPVPLSGNSSPIIWNDRLFLTGATDPPDKPDQKVPILYQVYCFDTASGQLLWQQDMPQTPSSGAGPPKVNPETGYASSTPITDGQRVYAMFATGDLAAFDFSGRLVWSRSLGVPKNPYGHAASLAMWRNLLIVQFDQTSAKEPLSKLIALHAATGEIAWQTPREVPASWCTPIIIQVGGQEQIITGGDPWVIAYRPADGKEIWRAECLRQDVAPSPVFAGGLVYMANAYPQLSAIRPDGQGDVTATHIVWSGEDNLPDTCSPLATPEYVLVLTSAGTLTCYEAKQGKQLWYQDFEATFLASPSLAGNYVYLVSEQGKVFVVQPSPAGCKKIAEADLGEPCTASPAFQDGRIYFRGKTHLFCIGKKPEG